jgi:ParB family chromosome partitioning protein
VRETEKLVKKIKSITNPETRKIKAPEPDPELLKLEDILRKNLGTKVKIVPRGKGGKIEISYTSAPELERLLDYLNIV